MKKMNCGGTTHIVPQCGTCGTSMKCITKCQTNQYILVFKLPWLATEKDKFKNRRHDEILNESE